ncbi:MAG: hypothetical protein ACYDAE_19815 [Steroidobacteraceae bacterium]
MLSCYIMLIQADQTLSIAEDLRRYLHDVLGPIPEISRWSGPAKTPYYLRDAFEFRELTLLGRKLLLAIEQRKKGIPPASVRDQIAALRRIAGIPVVYVTTALASYERKRLVQQKVPFIVPGNQLYLPELAIDLREYFRRRASPATTGFSPSTQAMLITALLRVPWNSVWQPSDAATTLGYTSMTVSRAVKELTEADIGEIRRELRVRTLNFVGGSAEVWRKAKPFLRSPVKRIVWSLPVETLQPSETPVAGLSALAEQTNLAEPQWPVRAVTSRRWLSATRAGLAPLPEPVSGAVEWQVWTYDPGLGTSRKIVDPLSLTLSLQSESDERVQLALEGLKENYPW